MSKQCERPGCSALAEVLYGFDPGRLLLWLEHGAIPDGTRSNALCRRHADSLAVPRGWSIDDRRESSPRLFSSPAISTNVVKLNPNRSRKRKNPIVVEPKLFDRAPLVDPEETKAMPWTPQFDPDDDLGGVLQARGRLLSRAFRSEPKPPTPTER